MIPLMQGYPLLIVLAFAVLQNLLTFQSYGQNQPKYLGLNLNSQELLARYGEPFKRIKTPFVFQFGANSINGQLKSLYGEVGPQSFFVKGLTPSNEKICDQEYILFRKQDYILAFCLFDNKAEEVQVMKIYKGSPTELPTLLPPFWGWEKGEVDAFVEKIFPGGKANYISPELLLWQGGNKFTPQLDGQASYGLAPEIRQVPLVDAALYNYDPRYGWCSKDSENNVFCFFVDSAHTSSFTQISRVLWVTTQKRSELIKNKYFQILEHFNSKMQNRSNETKQKINSI